jgi:hypothetical protein
VSCCEQAQYILIKGGTLTVGTDATPFPGRATITLHGPPDSRELPLYGAKVVAVREGRLVLHGQPKLPSWTQLNVTGHPGNSSITVAGPVNWVAGARDTRDTEHADCPVRTQHMHTTSTLYIRCLSLHGGTLTHHLMPRCGRLWRTQCHAG